MLIDVFKNINKIKIVYIILNIQCIFICVNIVLYKCVRFKFICVHILPYG